MHLKKTRGLIVFVIFAAILIPACRDASAETHNMSQGFRAYEKGGKYGFIDSSGVARISARFQAARDFVGNYATVKDQGQWKVIDREGKTVLVSKWPELIDITDDLVIFKDKAGRLGYAGLDGRIILGNLKQADSFSEGLAVVDDTAKISAEYGRTYISRNGQYINKAKRFLLASPFHNGRAVVAIKAGKAIKYGVVDQGLSYVVEPKYPNANIYSGYGDGLLGVLLGPSQARDNAKDRYGFIDVNGKMIMETNYSDVLPFSQNRSVVIQGGYYVTGGGVLFAEGASWKVIDKNNRVIVESRDWAFAYQYRDGFALIALRKGKFLNYAFLDLDGNAVFDQGYTLAHDFSGGLAYIEKGGRKGYLTTTGKEVWWDSLP